MNRQELLEEIRKLKSEKGLSKQTIAWPDFIELPEYEYLGAEYRRNRIRKKEKWHQIVRFAFSDPKEHRYMYNRLLQLLLKHRRSHTDYFKLKTESGTIALPDRRSDLNRLFILYGEFFDIFKNITNRIHFDYPTRQSSEHIIKGRINWQDTFRRYPTGLPLQFQTQKWIREFVVPENILLLIGANSLYKEARRLLQIDFAEPLDTDERSKLNIIVTNMEKGIANFPFADVFSEASRFFGLDISDTRIIQVEQLAGFRINQGTVKNPRYAPLIEWIRKLRELNIRMVSGSRTNFPLETMENLDTIYEAWLFFEFVDFFSQQHRLLELQIEESPKYFDFESDSHKLRFYYELEFPKGEGHAWALKSTPDFSVMEGDRIIAVFDAKNYDKEGGEKGDATNKMLAYLTNLDAGFGGLFFPNFETAMFKFPGENDKPKHHFNLQLMHYKMKPSDTPDALKAKHETLDSVNKEIGRRLEITIQ